MDYTPRLSDTAQITVRDILEMRSWGLTLLAGEGGLDRGVDWAHVFDITDPSGWLDGGEFVLMTGRTWSESPKGQIDLIQQLYKAGASGLGLGAIAPALTAEATSIASEMNFPVICVPRETGYLPIVKFVAAANGGSLQKGLVNALRVFESMSPTPEDSDTSSRFQQLERITGYQLSVVSRRGKGLFEGQNDLPPDRMARVQETVATTGKWKSLAIPGGYASPLTVGGRLAGFIVAVEQEESRTVNFSVFRAVETVARMELGVLYGKRESTRRHHAELLGRLLYLGGRPMSKNGREQTAAAGPFILAVIWPDRESVEKVDNEIHHMLADEQVWNLLLQEKERIIVVLELAHLSRFEEVVEDLPVSIGTSNEFSFLEESPLALRQASWALEYGRPIGMGSKLRSYSKEDTDWVQWLPSDPVALVQLVKQTLGELLEYDREKGANLIDSLRIYFEEDGRLQVAADRMFIHKHTLAYRLKRVESLTGRDINSVSDRSVLWLAMSALSVVSMFPEAKGLLR